jgi:hypothetical protein
LEDDPDLRGTASLVRGELVSEGRRSRLVGEATLTSLDKKLGAINALTSLLAVRLIPAIRFNVPGAMGVQDKRRVA